jgi:hypothetical protein
MKVDVPQEMEDRGEGGETFRRHHEMTVHGRCWDELVCSSRDRNGSLAHPSDSSSVATVALGLVGIAPVARNS